MLPDGALDYADDVLAELDWVVASVHTSFRMPKAEMTARIVRAIEHPYVDCIGHLSGRKILQRAPYEFDFEAVLEAAVRTGTMLEINANPDRRDLNELHARDAAARRRPAGDQLRRAPHRRLRGRALRGRDGAPRLAHTVSDREYSSVDGSGGSAEPPARRLNWTRANHRQPAQGADQRNPEVQAHAEDVLRVVDPQRLLEDAEGRVAGDVQREQRRAGEPCGGCRATPGWRPAAGPR